MQAIPDRLRRLEIEIWVDTLHLSLQPEIIQRLADVLASGEGGAAVWAELDHDQRRQVERARQAHGRSAKGAFTTALVRFREHPASIHLVVALRALDGVVTSRSRRDAFSDEQPSRELDRLVCTIRDTIPPVASEILALQVEQRFLATVDQSWLEKPLTKLGRFGQKSLWTPTGEDIGSANAQVEPLAVWFVPEVQALYEKHLAALEKQLAQAAAEAEHQAHAAAEAEARRHEEEIAAERRKQEEERVERELARTAAQDREQRKELNRQRAHEEAPRIVQAQMRAQGLSLKHLPEPERNAAIRQAEGDLIRRWEGR